MASNRGSEHRADSKPTSVLLGLFPDTKNRLGRMKGYGSCYRCGDSWYWKKEHTTTFSGSEGCFPLCEECWSQLTPEERLPYYAQVMHAWTDRVEDRPEWALDSLRKWPAIEQAVLSGL